MRIRLGGSALLALMVCISCGATLAPSPQAAATEEGAAGPTAHATQVPPVQSAGGTATTYYVSPTGDNANPGTRNRP